MNKLSFIIVFFVILSPFKCFVFSVIIAVYNTGRYLDDSIGSLVKQTIGLDKIQIILVNDGSTDNSEEICLKYKKEYPNNIIYIKIEHGGVSRARNTGLEYTSGEFINFLDADDKWDSQAFRYVLLFFKINTNVNIAAGRLLFFEAINTYHPLDYKFYETRVVNLTKEYNCIHLSGPSSFFRKHLIKEKKFVEGVFSGEDTIFINNILLLNPIIGYIREAIYYYRRRADHSSAVQNQIQKVDFYFSQLKYVGQYLIDKSKELYNKVIPFIQFYIGYNDLFRILSPAYKFLNRTNFNEYCKAIEGQLKQIEDKYILEQKFTSYKNKIFTLSKKYNRDLRFDIIYKNHLLIYSGYVIMNLKNNNNLIIWRFFKLKGNRLHLEGKDNFWMPKETYFFFCVIGNKTFFPTYIPYSGYDYYTMYGLIEKGRVVIFDILIQNLKEQIIQFFISYKGNNVEIFPSLGGFTHIPNVRDGYYANENFLIKIIKRRLYIYRYNKILEKSFEMQYCTYLKSIRKENIIKLRKKSKKSSDKNNKKKEIWIINDRQYQAGDNGEYFFRYLIVKNLKKKKIYFAIKKECDDYKRLKKFKNILDLGSKKYLELFLKSDKIISSISEVWVTNPFGEEQKYIKDLLHFDFILIQSGLIKDDSSNNLNRIIKNFILLITLSKIEYKSILASKYNYNIDNVLSMGSPRFDNLEEIKNKINKEKLIVIFPEWRPYIIGTLDIITNKSIYSDEYENAKFFNNLINHPKLISNLKKFNYTGILCLNPYFNQQKKVFTSNNYFSISDSCNYQELLIKASLFITDHSNLFFDIAYIKKPIIYAQFVIEEYKKYNYKTYFDYKKDGFGPVCFDIECTVEEIIKEMNINCILKKNYLRRIQKYFDFSNKNNNDRIFYTIENNNEGYIKKKNGYNSCFILTFFTFFLFIIRKKY